MAQMVRAAGSETASAAATLQAEFLVEEAARIAADAAAAAAIVAARLLLPYNVKDYGAVGDGTTDDYAAIMSAITACYNGGGGIVYFPPATYKVASVITMPDNANATKPLTVPIRLVGVGPQWAGRNSVTTTGGSVLNMTATDTYGKLRTKGVGFLGVEGLTFTDTSGGTTPFLYTTNTTLHVEQCAFIGTKDTTACDQDAIICGGTTAPEGGGWDNGFQGYGTVISRNYFNHIRRAVYGRKYFNSNVIRDNTIWAQCGNATGGAIEINGSPVSGSDYNSGNTISNNLIEVVGYDYAIDLEWAFQNTITGNSAWDASGTTLGSVRLQSNTERNWVQVGFDTVGVVDTGQRNTVHTTMQGEYTRQGMTTFYETDYPTIFDKVSVVGAGNAVTVQPTASQTDFSALLRVLRSAAEGTNPGTAILTLTQNANLILGGDTAGNIQFKDAAGNTLSSFGNNGCSWNGAAAGSHMFIDTKNDSYRLYVRGGGIRLENAASANSAFIFTGTASPEGAQYAPVGSLFLRTDGGASTTLYVKESGAGATGWVAK